jgi:hypothetical protein
VLFAVSGKNLQIDRKIPPSLYLAISRERYHLHILNRRQSCGTPLQPTKSRSRLRYLHVQSQEHHLIPLQFILQMNRLYQTQMTQQYRMSHPLLLQRQLEAHPTFLTTHTTHHQTQVPARSKNRLGLQRMKDLIEWTLRVVHIIQTLYSLYYSRLW